MSDSTVTPVSQLPTAIDPALTSSLANLPGFDRTVKTTLDQNDFLKLLATQMANQDPLNPSTDLSSISQMASFSSAQAMGTMVTNLQAFMTQQNWNNTQSYLGKWIMASDSSGITMGVVTSVAHDTNGNPVVTVNGKDISPSNISQVRDSAPGTDPATPTVNPTAPGNATAGTDPSAPPSTTTGG